MYCIQPSIASNGLKCLLENTYFGLVVVSDQSQYNWYSIVLISRQVVAVKKSRGARKFGPRGLEPCLLALATGYGKGTDAGGDFHFTSKKRKVRTMITCYMYFKSDDESR